MRSRSLAACHGAAHPRHGARRDTSGRTVAGRRGDSRPLPEASLRRARAVFAVTAAAFGEVVGQWHGLGEGNVRSAGVRGRPDGAVDGRPGHPAA
ncbi:hypothetical protein AQF52_0408 [Streptomyces venezuelae]|nr:hypothetical protein AQF52_0408 [Streptomyces venezuelae]CUM43766.1 hypothetical protein BN2537_16497 [Streptomyces venezuelae]